MKELIILFLNWLKMNETLNWLEENVSQDKYDIMFLKIKTSWIHYSDNFLQTAWYQYGGVSWKIHTFLHETTFYDALKV